MEVVRELSGAIQGARRTPLSRGSSWSAAELDPQVASPGLSRHRLSGRECILAETLHQRGNRAVTNKQFARWSYACSQLGTHANADIEQTTQTTSSCRVRQALLCLELSLAGVSNSLRSSHEEPTPSPSTARSPACYAALGWCDCSTATPCTISGLENAKMLPSSI